MHPTCGCAFFLNGLATVGNFKGLMKLMDGWSVSMRGELTFVERSLTLLKFQVSNLIACYNCMIHAKCYMCVFVLFLVTGHADNFLLGSLDLVG